MSYRGETELQSRVTFDQVDRALAHVPYLAPKLRYWGVVYVLELDDEQRHGTVLFKTPSERDYRSALEFVLKWIAEGNLQSRLEKDGVPREAIAATVVQAQRKISGALHGTDRSDG